MLSTFNFSAYLPFRSAQEATASSATPTEKVHKSKIKSVVVSAFLASLPKDSPERSSCNRQNVEIRLTSNLLDKSYYHIPCHKQPLASDEILDWFAKGKYGEQLHRRAIASGDREVASFLRKAHVDVNQPDENTGDTPLILAARTHDYATVKELLIANATVSARNQGKKDAIYEALENLNRTSFRNGTQFKTIKCLLKHGADVNQPLLHRPATRLSEFTIPKAELRVARLLISYSKFIKTNTVFALARVNSIDSPDILNYLIQQRKFDPNEITGTEPNAILIPGTGKKPQLVQGQLIYPETAKEFADKGRLQYENKYFVAAILESQGKHKELEELLLDDGALEKIPRLPTNKTLHNKQPANLAAIRKSDGKSTGISGVLFPYELFGTKNTASGQTTTV